MSRKTSLDLVLREGNILFKENFLNLIESAYNHKVCLAKNSFYMEKGWKTSSKMMCTFEELLVLYQDLLILSALCTTMM